MQDVIPGMARHKAAQKGGGAGAGVQDGTVVVGAELRAA
jgi:hypothetical protein